MSRMEWAGRGGSRHEPKEAALKTGFSIVTLQISSAQLGWVIDGIFSVPTRRQSTNEEHQAQGFGHTIVGALWDFRKSCALHAWALRKKEGGHDLRTSNWYPGLLFTGFRFQGLDFWRTRRDMSRRKAASS